jgi:ABC-type uncharacterized transport system permease subunit
MRLYREIMTRAFQSHTAYRMDTMMHLVSSLFAILIQTTIWRAIYQGNSEMASNVGNVSMQEMLTYSRRTDLRSGLRRRLTPLDLDLGMLRSAI